MSGHNAIADMEAARAPMAPGMGYPAHETEIHPAATITKDEKDLAVGSTLPLGAHDSVTVHGAADLADGEEEPTEEEYATLRKVSAPLKWAAIAMCIVELAERASYYGCKDVFANFVRGPLPEGGNGAGAVAPGALGSDQTAGALGMGSVAASATTSTFTFLSYCIPILGGILADAKWGRFRTVWIGTLIGIFAHAFLIVPTIPAVINTGHAYIPFILAVMILAFAAGAIKPSLGPMLCDQSPVKKPVIKTSPTGERYILDPQATVQRYLLVFYWCINVGGFFSVATTYSERFVGFWLAYLEPGIVYMICPVVLWWVKKRLYHAPPQGSVVIEAWRVVKTAVKRNGILALFKGGDVFWNSAKPSVIEATDGIVDRVNVFWDDLFVDEIRQSFSACSVSMLIPIFNLADGGIGNMLNDLSASLTLDNVPNDIINNFNPLTIIVATPIITFGLYPLFEKMGYPIKPMTRMCIGFLLGVITMVYGAILQWKVYTSSPCGYNATDCEAGPSSIHLMAMIPLYAIPALGEIFINVTSYELAYTRAPARMKGLVYAIILFNQAISAAIGLACSKAIDDPNLIWPYVALGAACLICAVLCPTYFRGLNKPMRSFANVDRQHGLQQPNMQDPNKMMAESDDVREKV